MTPERFHAAGGVACACGASAFGPGDDDDDDDDEVPIGDPPDDDEGDFDDDDDDDEEPLQAELRAVGHSLPCPDVVPAATKPSDFALLQRSIAIRPAARHNGARPGPRLATRMF